VILSSVARGTAAWRRPTDALSLSLEAAYLLIFAASVVRFLRRPTRLHADVLIAFAAYATVFVISTLVALVPELRPIGVIAALALFAQPYATVRVLRDFTAVTVRSDRLALLAFLASAASYLAFGPRSLPSLLFIGVCFVGVEGYVASRFWTASRGRVGSPRLRLAAASLATGLFAASVAGLLVASALGQGAPLAPAVTVTIRLGVLCSALLYLAAFAPPARLRSFLSRASAYDLTRDVISVEGSGPAETWARLAHTAARILGAENVRIEQSDGSPIAESGQTGATAPDAPARGTRHVKIRLGGDRPKTMVLIAEIETGALFEEDDMALVALLGAVTAQAVEREEALIELTEIRASLAEAQAQQASEIRFRALLDAEPSAVVVADAAGNVRYANSAAAAIFHQPPDGQSLYSLVRPELRWTELADATWHDAIGVRADGTEFPAEIAVSPLEAGSGSLTVAVVTDVTQRRAAEEIRDRFIDMLSHELRTPVTTIYGGATLLAARSERLDQASSREVVESMAAEAERLHRIVENLLVLARVERGSDLRRVEPLLVSRLLPGIVVRERELWPGARFELSMADRTVLAAGDEEYLRQIVQNLLSNAAKYAGDAGPIDIQLSADAGWRVELRVADHGPGFLQDDAERLFELYFRSEVATRRAPGSGVGLFVSRRLAEAIGARLTASVRPGGGAVFTLSLAPFDEDANEARTDEGVAPAPQLAVAAV